MATGSFRGLNRPGRGVGHPPSGAEIKERGPIFLVVPEDDYIRIETCRPDTIIKIIKMLLCLTDTSLCMFIYICVEQLGMAKGKLEEDIARCNARQKLAHWKH